MTFGGNPELVASLSSTEIDLDRILGLPETMRRRPLSAIKSLAEKALAGGLHLPVPVRLGIGVDAVTMAGATLQHVGADLSFDGVAWDMERVEFRAPGFTQVSFSGRLGAAPTGVAFAGATKVRSADPRMLIAWVAGRDTTQLATTGPLRFESDIVLGPERMVFDRFQVDVEHMNVAGRLNYAWPAGDAPARLEASLRAPEFDLDRAQALVIAGLGNIPLQWPEQGSLAIDVDRLVGDGIVAKDVVVNVRRDAGGIDIERLAIGDLSGTKLAVSGHIDMRQARPRGALNLDLEASSVDGLAMFVDKFSSTAADRLRRQAARAVPAKLHSSLLLDNGKPDASGRSTTELKLVGSAGTFRVELSAGARISGELALGDLAKLPEAEINLVGRVDAADGSALVEMTGLDRLVSVDRRPGRLTLDAVGPLHGDLVVDSRLVAGGLDVAAKGTARLTGGAGPTAALALEVAAANVLALQSAARARSVQPVAATFTGGLALADRALNFTDLKGAIGGAGINGRFSVGLTQPVRVDGEIGLGILDLPAAVAATLGVQRQSGNEDVLWAAEPFEPGLLSNVGGRIAVNVGRLTLTSNLFARDVRAAIGFDRSEIAISGIDGTMAGGRIAGDFKLQRGSETTSVQGRVRLAGAVAADLLGSEGRPPISGRLALDLNIDGGGRSPVALIGSLKGTGSFTLQDGSLARFDPAAFDAVIRAVDQGLPLDGPRLTPRVEAALENGSLPISLAEGSLALAMGQLRLDDTIVHANGGDLAVRVGVDLVRGVVDAKLALARRMDAAPGTRPEILVSFKGPIGAPKRTVDVTTLASWLALRAIDRQAKRLNALNNGGNDAAVDTGDLVDPATSAPAAALAPSDLPSPSGAALAPAALRRTIPRIPTAQQSAPAAPLDIRPQSTPRASGVETTGSSVDASHPRLTPRAPVTSPTPPKPSGGVSPFGP